MLKNKANYFLVFILALACAYLGYKNMSETEYVYKVYALNNIPAAWNKPISDSINKGIINVKVDGVPVPNGGNDSGKRIYMSENMIIMLPSDIISEAFNCAVNVYDKSELIIEKGDKVLKLKVGDNIMPVNDEEIILSEAPVIKGNDVYVPAEAVTKGLMYNYDRNISGDTATFESAGEGRVLPYKYDYRERGKAPTVKDQGKFGTCWAFAALTALESSLMPEEKPDFAIDHMSIANSFDLKQNDGGEANMSVAYLAAWQGPVLTKDDPYGDGVTDMKLEPVKHIREVRFIEAKNYEKIKEMIYKYGAVQSSLYTNLSNAASRSKYYNQEAFAYCYVGTQKPNHDVVIIGWDDTYPKENFTTGIENDGAFICQNSWGTGFGDNGVFYVSYYDTNIGMHNTVYTKVDNPGNYDNIYQSDLLGVVGYMGYGRDTAYAANVYTAAEDEEVAAVSFYATGMNTSYTVYVCNDFKTTEDLLTRSTAVASGKFDMSGYYTVDFNWPVRVDAGNKYAVTVKITTPNSTKPIAVEYNNGGNTSSADISDGEGYISWSGKTWERTEESHGCNICLKAFTNNCE